MTAWIVLRVSTHSHPKVAATSRAAIDYWSRVSTHSHPKVAACRIVGNGARLRSFNTQPPEGGCAHLGEIVYFVTKFQHTATRRWLREYPEMPLPFRPVSTHSHPKVAALAPCVSP